MAKEDPYKDMPRETMVAKIIELADKLNALASKRKRDKKPLSLPTKHALQLCGMLSFVLFELLIYGLFYAAMPEAMRVTGGIGMVITLGGGLGALGIIQNWD